MESVSGGITNQNFRVSDSGQDYFVRIGEDIPEHGVMRFNELAASKAAWEAGISPEVLYAEPGVLVLEFIQGKTLSEADFSDHKNLSRAVELIKDCHYKIPNFLNGPVLSFWVFQVIRNYCNRLESNSAEKPVRLGHRIPELRKTADVLSVAVGPVELTFGHNDLLPANFIDDGSRMWLIDWDYAGFNSALFDLGGLASNNGLVKDQELEVISSFYGCEPDRDKLRSYYAMKCASLLRESMWSMMSEIKSEIDFDFPGYTDNNLEKFSQAFHSFAGEYL